MISLKYHDITYVFSGIKYLLKTEDYSKKIHFKRQEFIETSFGEMLSLAFAAAISGQIIFKSMPIM